MKTILCSIVALGIFGLGAALQCYQCVGSATDGPCSMGDVSSLDTVQCKDPEGYQNRALVSYCVTLAVSTNGGNTTSFQRGCSLVDETLDICDYVAQQVEEVLVCEYCTTDLCNV